MLLNSETDYAIRIVSCLAKKKEKTSASVISKETGVTVKFALKILHTLSVNGIVKSFKGKNGGYILNKKPEEITLLQIIELFGGTMFVNKCEHSECCTMPGGICEFKEVFSEATEFLNQHFGKVVFKGWIQ